MTRGKWLVVGLLAAVVVGGAGAAWWLPPRPAAEWRPPEEIAFELGVYFLPEATADPRRVLAEAAREGVARLP